MRVFYDANIVLSTILWRGEVYRTHRALVEQGYVPITSERVVREVLNVIARKFLAFDPSEIEPEIRQEWEIVPESRKTPSVTLRDPDDEGVLADAESAHADLLLSSDRDFLDVRETITTIVVLNIQDFNGCISRIKHFF